jgi:hypothetical protein
MADQDRSAWHAVLGGFGELRAIRLGNQLGPKQHPLLASGTNGKYVIVEDKLITQSTADGQVDWRKMLGPELSEINAVAYDAAGWVIAGDFGEDTQCHQIGVAGLNFNGDQVWT